MSWLGYLSDFGPAPLAVDVYWESYPGKKAHVWKLWNQSGWMRVAEVTLETPTGSYVDKVVSFCDDWGRPVQAWLGERLFDMRASVPTYMHAEPPDELGDQIDALYWDFLGRCDLQSLKELRLAEEKLDQDIEAVEAKVEAGIQEIDTFATTLRRERRHPDCLSERHAEISARLNAMQLLKPKLLQSASPARDRIRRAHESYEQDVYEGLTHHGRLDILYTVRWTMRSRHSPAPMNASIWTEARFSENLNAGGLWKSELKAEFDGPTSRAVSKVAGQGAIEEPPRNRRALEKTIASVVQERPLRQALSKRSSPPPRPEPTPQTESDTSPTPVVPEPEKAYPGWAHRERKRAVKNRLIASRNGQSVKPVLKRVGHKSGESLKMALIGLAKDGQITTEDAVYLFKVLSDIN